MTTTTPGPVRIACTYDCALDHGAVDGGRRMPDDTPVFTPRSITAGALQGRPITGWSTLCGTVLLSARARSELDVAAAQGNRMLAAHTTEVWVRGTGTASEVAVVDYDIEGHARLPREAVHELLESAGCHLSETSPSPTKDGKR